MPDLDEAVKAVIEGLSQRIKEKQQTRIANEVRNKIRLPNTGAGDDTGLWPDGDGATDTAPPAAPPGKQWYQDPGGGWVLGESADNGPMFPVPATGKERIERGGWGGLPVGYNSDPALTTDVPYESGRFGPAIGLSPQEWQLRVAAGLDDDYFKDLLEGPGGGSDNTVGLANLAENKRQFDLQFAEQQRLAQIESMFGLVGLDVDRQQRAAQERQNQQQMIAELAPMMAGGRTHMGGFEPYGAQSAVANYAGVPYTPRPIVQQPVPVGIPDEQPSSYLAELRALLGV